MAASPCPRSGARCQSAPAESRASHTPSTLAARVRAHSLNPDRCHHHARSSGRPCHQGRRPPGQALSRERSARSRGRRGPVRWPAADRRPPGAVQGAAWTPRRTRSDRSSVGERTSGDVRPDRAQPDRASGPADGAGRGRVPEGPRSGGAAHGHPAPPPASPATGHADPRPPERGTLHDAGT